jgi:sulfatase modifying factor 1
MRRSTRLLRVPLAAASLWLFQAPAAAQVTFAWTTVGEAGNVCDPQGVGRCFGSVGYRFRISKHEVTNAQYAEFLNAKAASDPLELYSSQMASSLGGIARSGSPGDYVYSTIAGRENRPVTYVSFFDALRFANWLHNGQGDGDTETGAYTLLGGTPTPSNPLLARNASATVFLSTDAEWYKAAYYDGAGLYYDYPAGTDTVIACAAPGATPNTANCAGAASGLTDVGSYTSSLSPSGTFDQGGNVAEWVETEAGVLENRFIRGGAFGYAATRLRGQVQDYDDPWFESGGLGFRLASVDGGGGSQCGNAVCESTEDPLACPGDCADLCGDALCSGDEDALSCPPDCPRRCGDGLCSGGETTVTCWPDCGVCGDDFCDPSENEATCEADCAPFCGDGVVQAGEQCEVGVPLGASCTSLGFGGGTLTCSAATCAYNTSGCTSAACQPHWARCSTSAECCSGTCWLRRCWGN